MAEVASLLLSPFLQVFFEQMASGEFLEIFRRRKLNEGLLRKLKIALLSVNALLEDAEEKQLTKPAVRVWLDELKDVVYDAEDILDEIATELLQRKLDAEFQTTASKMDNTILSAAMTTVASVIAVGLVILNDIISRRVLRREPHVNREYERGIYMDSILYGSRQDCINQIRMSPIAFFELCKILDENNLIRETINTSIKEQVLIFLHIIGHNVRFRVVGGRFYRLIRSIHRYFKVVLGGVLTLYKHLIKQPDNSTPLEIRNSRRFYPYFKDCVGAIDGTHVRASVPVEIQGRFRGRKDRTTQNVLAGITFDVKFTYMLAGWEGSAHDSRVLNDALTRPGGFKIPEGKYYLGDAGYGNRNGILSPYRGVWYHLKEFSDHPPENEKELFNLRHSSLRTTIERGFEILKRRFRVLDAEPFWSFETQVEVVLACCVIHNHIMGVDPNDSIMEEEVCDVESQNQSGRVYQTRREIQEESREWTIKRDVICHAMWEDYKNRRNV